MKLSRIACLLLLFVLLLAGCNVSQSEPAPFVGASITGATLDTDESGEELPFHVAVVQTGDPVGVDFRGILIAGSVQLQLRAVDGDVVFADSISTPGPFAINTTLTPSAGTYQMGLVWDAPLEVQYNLVWQPQPIEIPQLTLLTLLPGLGMILVACTYFGYALWRRLGARYLALGALAWVITVALKFAWAIPINTPVYTVLYGALPETFAGPLFYLYVGALTGVFEVALTWFLLRYTRLGRVPWGPALAFGIGFGAVEALLLGGGALIPVLLALMAPHTLPLEALHELAKANNLLYSIAPIVERLFTVLLHVCSNVLLFYAVAKKQPRWFWLAFIYKTAIDTVAAWGQLTGLQSLGKIWAIEAIVIVFGVLGWWGLHRMRADYPEADLHSTPPGV